MEELDILHRKQIDQFYEQLNKQFKDTLNWSIYGPLHEQCYMMLFFQMKDELQEEISKRKRFPRNNRGVTRAMQREKVTWKNWIGRDLSDFKMGLHRSMRCSISEENVHKIVGDNHFFSQVVRVIREELNDQFTRYFA
jgi:hypothetical protein